MFSIIFVFNSTHTCYFYTSRPTFPVDPIYLILEYAPNGNLKEYLDKVRTGVFKGDHQEKRESISSVELLTFGYQIACGMTFLSEKEVKAQTYFWLLVASAQR